MLDFQHENRGFRPKRPKIWRRLEKCVPLHCQKETMEFGRRAPKYFSQAWKNLLSAQSAKKEVANGDKEKPKQKLKPKQKRLTN